MLECKQILDRKEQHQEARLTELESLVRAGDTTKIQLEPPLHHRGWRVRQAELLPKNSSRQLDEELVSGIRCRHSMHR